VCEALHGGATPGRGVELRAGGRAGQVAWVTGRDGGGGLGVGREVDSVTRLGCATRKSLSRKAG
jgi:hypothetical protein